MNHIKLTNGGIAIVDDEDFERLNKKKWQLSKNGYAYRCQSIDKHRVGISMHRVIMDCPKGMQVDHINHNRLDNRKKNLRICSNKENSWNRGNTERLHSSIYKGVYWFKSNKCWRTMIDFDNKHLHIGLFDSELHAAMAYDIWAKELHGKFAKLNL